MNILIPTPITDAVLVSSTIAEPAAGETAWVSAGTYVLGDQRIRTATHRVYECIQAHTGRTALPEADPLYWEDISPTNRWAAFDIYENTKSRATTSLAHVLSPGFFNNVKCYGLAGNTINATVKAGAGGTVIFDQAKSLYEEAGGLFEYLFAPHRYVDRVSFKSIPLHPSAELTLTVSGATGSEVAVGIVNVGLASELVSADAIGGTEQGASVEPVTYSRIKTDEFGTTKIKRGHAATGMRASVLLPIEDANNAIRVIRQVLDVPVSVEASDIPGYEWLNVFGLISASMSDAEGRMARLSLNVKGMI